MKLEPVAEMPVRWFSIVDLLTQNHFLIPQVRDDPQIHPTRWAWAGATGTEPVDTMLGGRYALGTDQSRRDA